MPTYYLNTDPEFTAWIQARMHRADQSATPVGDDMVRVTLSTDHDLFVIGMMWEKYLASPEGVAMLAAHSRQYHEKEISRLRPLAADGNAYAVESIAWHEQELSK